MQLAQLAKVISSTALQTALAEQYVGSPLPGTAAHRKVATPRRAIRHRGIARTPPQMFDSGGRR